MQFVVLALIGLLAGLSSGLFGIGGGVIIVPALVYLARFTQHKATGTSLAVLLPPVGIAATWEYYRQGNVDLKAALIIAAFLVLGSWVSSLGANKMSGSALQVSFGVFLITLGLFVVFDACRK